MEQEHQPPYEGEPSPSLKQQLTAAIKAGDAQAVMTSLRAIDQKLTAGIAPWLDPNNDGGKRYLSQIEQFLAQIERRHPFPQLIVALGDGGVSRLKIDLEEDELMMELTLNSSPAVIEAWDQLV